MKERVFVFKARLIDNDQEKVCESIEDIIEAYEAKIREKNNVLG